MDANKDKIIEDIGIQRYNHSLRVMETSIELANLYKEDVEKARLASYYHDCGKYKDKAILLKRAESFGIIKDNKKNINIELIHGVLGAKIAEKDYGIKDKDILNAIARHTTGNEDMTNLDKIVYISDYIEPMRNFQGVDIARKLAYEDLDKAMIFALNNTIRYLIEKNLEIAVDTILARNNILRQVGENNVK